MERIGLTEKVTLEPRIKRGEWDLVFTNIKFEILIDLKVLR